MKKFMIKFFRHFLFILSIIAIIILVLSLIFMLLGYRPFIIKSESMEPLYPKGSLIFIDTKFPLNDIKAGDVIAYRSSTDTLVLHRLIFMKGGYFLLQGDANNDTQTLHLNDINFIGRDLFLIPRLGFVIENILGSSGLLWLMIISLLILSYVPWL